MQRIGRRLGKRERWLNGCGFLLLNKRPKLRQVPGHGGRDFGGDQRTLVKRNNIEANVSIKLQGMLQNTEQMQQPYLLCSDAIQNHACIFLPLRILET